MRQTCKQEVQVAIAREVAQKTRRNFTRINPGFARAVANAMNDAGYILSVQLGKVEFIKDPAASMVLVRSDNIYVPTPLAVVLAAGRALEHLPILKPQGVNSYAEF